MTCERFSLHGKRYDFDDMVIQPRQVQPGGPPLWIQAEYHGEFVSFELTMAWPKPVQKPHPPIIGGGAFPFGARRALRYGNG